MCFQQSVIIYYRVEYQSRLVDLSYAGGVYFLVEKWIEQPPEAPRPQVMHVKGHNLSLRLDNLEWNQDTVQLFGHSVRSN